MTVREKYARYVSQNILGMIGISLYILADTFFISKAQGALGVAALNLVLPVFSLIFAIGAMMGVGSAIRFSIDKAMGNKGAETYFFMHFYGDFFWVCSFCFSGCLFRNRFWGCWVEMRKL